MLQCRLRNAPRRRLRPPEFSRHGAAPTRHSAVRPAPPDLPATKSLTRPGPANRIKLRLALVDRDRGDAKDDTAILLATYCRALRCGDCYASLAVLGNRCQPSRHIQ